MKQFHTSILLPLMFFGTSIQGQNSYTFEHANEPYSPLTDGISCTFDNDGYQVLTEFNGETFWFYGIPLTMNGNHLMAIGDIGTVTAQNDSSLMVIDILFLDLQEIDQTSDILYSITGTPGDRTLTVEWRNWRLPNGPVGNFVNCQIVVHQATGIVELKYGPNSGSEIVYNDSNGPHAGMTYVPSDFSGSYEKLWIEQNALAPTLDSVPNFDFDSMHNLPAPNTVFRLIPRLAPTSVSEASKQEQIVAFYDMDDDLIILEHLSNAPLGDIALYDLQGQVLKKWISTTSRTELPMGQFRSGVYLLRSNSVGAIKFIKP